MSGKKGAKHFPVEIRERIESMKAAGKTHREIASAFGLEKRQIKEYFYRLHKKERGDSEVRLPRRKGRPRKTPLTKERALELEILELRREVELYKSFLHAAGRM